MQKVIYESISGMHSSCTQVAQEDTTLTTFKFKIGTN